MSPLWPRRRRPVEQVEGPAEETAVIEERPAAEEVVEEEVPPPRPPLIWPWLLVLLLLVLAGGLAWWLLTRGDDKTTMPGVIGLTEPAARARLAAAELETDVDRRPSKRRRGIVFAQTPGAGTQLDEGERVEILVSSGFVRVPVPVVVGLPEQRAVSTIADAGLRAKVKRVFAGAPKGRVVEQDPRGAERVRRGTTVLLTVSKGRNLNTVPDVVGRREAEAVRLLRARGFEPRIFDVPASEPAGTVVAQVPPGGAQAPPDSRVRINVSTGQPAGQPRERTTPTQTTPTRRAQRVTVPPVVGLAQTPALRRLRDAGLQGVVAFATSNEPRGRVLAQRPIAGSSVRGGAQVRITVSAGQTTQQEEVPDVVDQELEAATTTIRDAGFRVEVIRVPTDDPGRVGIVVDQQPAGGTTAPRGAVVTLFVGEAG